MSEPARNRTPLLECRGLNKSFTLGSGARVDVIRGLDLQVAAIAIIIASITNTLVKIGLTAIAGSPTMTRQVSGALIIIVAIGTITTLGTTVKGVFANVNTELAKVAGGGGT